MLHLNSICPPQAPHRVVSCPNYCFILYTNNWGSQYEDRRILKFTVETVVDSLLWENESLHEPAVSDFAQWFYHLLLRRNIAKTKDTVSDFRKISLSPSQTSRTGCRNCRQLQVPQRRHWYETELWREHWRNMQERTNKGCIFNVDRHRVVLFYRLVI